MKINAWIQMGHERREVTFNVDELSRETPTPEDFELAIEDLVLEWIRCRFGWGWTGGGFDNDFSFMEDSESVGLVETNEVLNPRTERKLLIPGGQTH